MEKWTTSFHRPAPTMVIPKNAPAEPMATVFRPRYETRKKIGTTTPWTNPSPDWRLRVVPRRGLPVTSIKVPRRYQRALLEERRSRWNDPRGPLRGGPARSASGPQTPPKKTTQQSTKGESRRSEGKDKTHHRHGGRKLGETERKKVGTTFTGRRVESWILLGGHGPERQGLP